MTNLSIKGLSRIYGEMAVVDRLTLDIASGEFISLLGASGCGKTTTLRMIAGFVEPSEGTIEVDGRVISSPRKTVPPEGRGMSMIFQSYAIWPHLTVRGNVEFGLKLRRVPREEMRRRVGEVLDLVRLSHIAERYPSQLSGGQQQRVALARAIVVKPRILLLDEPLSNLDAALREDMSREIRRLHDELGLTTVYVTHDQAEAMRGSDRIAVMNRGRIEQLSSPAELYAHPGSEFVARFIGKTNILALRPEGGQAELVGLGCRFTPPASATAIDAQSKLSLRPHDIALAATPPAAGGPAVPVQVVGRSYLGESWEYLVAPDGEGPALSVMTPARTTFAVGDRLWATLDLAGAEVIR